MTKINDEGFLELSGVNHNPYQEQLNAEKFAILESLTPLSLRVLNQALHVMHVSKGVEMMHVGDTPHDLYFISKGSVAVGKEHKEKIGVVAKLGEGNFFGEYGALRGKTRFASVRTLENSEIIRVDLKAVQQVFDADAKFKEAVYTIMRQRMLSSFLFSHPIFQKLEGGVRDTIASGVKIIELERNQMLFKAGDKAGCYYIILTGEAEVLAVSKKASTVVEIRRDNNILGEVRVEQDSVYGYSVYAANSLDLLVLDDATLQFIKKVSAPIAAILSDWIAKSAKTTTSEIKKVLA